MRQRRLRYLLNVLLLAAAIAAILTGYVADRLDLNEFSPHRWAGYVAAVLIAVHVGVRWRWLLPSRWRGQGSRVSTGIASAGEPAVPGASRGPVHDRDRPESTGVAVVAGEEPEAQVQVGDTAASDGGPGMAHPTRRVALTAAGAGMAGAIAGWAARSEVAPAAYDGGDVGLFYHRESSLGVRDLLSDLVDWGRRPAPYLEVGTGPPVPLPAVGEPPKARLAELLEQRRSLRQYADRAVTGQELAWVIRAATGITSPQGYRTAPSAGALYPIETYVAVRRVDGVEPGLYHVDVRGPALEPVRSGSVAGDLMVAGLGQDFLRRAPVVLVLTGRFQRTRWKYRERHYRYVCWEAGHVTQNIYLAAESLGLGACMVGAFLDGMVNDLVAADGRTEAALGLIALGPR